MTDLRRHIFLAEVAAFLADSVAFAKDERRCLWDFGGGGAVLVWGTCGGGARARRGDGLADSWAINSREDILRVLWTDDILRVV